MLKFSIIYKVALDITKEQFDKNYVPVQKHPKFNDVMTKVDYLLKIKSEDIKSLKGLILIQKFLQRTWNIYT